MAADLTYFVGRPFVSVEGGDEWVIVLDGNARITNYDHRRSAPDPDTLVGTSFILPIFSELDTRLQFGRNNADTGEVEILTEVTLTPALYTISDPNYATTEVYPQVPQEIADELPPDPSADRVADGPEEPQGDEEPQQEEPKSKKKASKAS